MGEFFHAAWSDAADADGISAELIEQLGPAPAAVILFFSPARPGPDVASRLRAAWPTTQIVGCSTAGEIATGIARNSSVCAAALRSGLVGRCAVAVADYRAGVQEGVAAAVRQLEGELGPLRSLDPERYVGLIYIDSTHGIEELTHDALGNFAPQLQFVGGSAGDDLAFVETTALGNDQTTHHGCALMVLEVERPFRVVKSCHFKPTAVSYTATKADGRTLFELDGRPAAEVFSEYVGVPPQELSFDNLMLNPIGVVIDGEPWIRQPVPPFQDRGAVTLGCAIAEGSTVHFLERRCDLVAHLRSVLSDVRADLGAIQGLVMSDCALRRMELENEGIKDDYAKLLDFPVVGFHTHGESWIGHMHQTFTGLFFG